MTDKEIERIAKLMGARIIAKLPGPLHGAPGAAYAAGFYNARMQELRRKETQHGIEPLTNESLEITVDANTRQTLQSIAQQASTPDKPLDVSQVAATVLQTAVGKIRASSADFGKMVADLRDLRSQVS